MANSPFSDGVFAIAVTLLVLDLHVPESDLNDLWHGIVHQWPNYLAYATSFITIGGIWLAHHAIFRRLRYVNTQVMRLNLLLLMTVSFPPFPTGLAAQAIRDTNAERVAVIFYGTSLLLVSVVLAALWRTPRATPSCCGRRLRSRRSARSRTGLRPTSASTWAPPCLRSSTPTPRPASTW
jgi:uncharacterized membrane protein